MWETACAKALRLARAGVTEGQQGDWGQGDVRGTGEGGVRGERQVGLEGITIIPMCLHSSHPCLSDCHHVPCQGYLPLG